ncbi:MAG TPA: CHAT domain-containing protein [Gemmatimonadales bacterium]
MLTVIAVAGSAAVLLQGTAPSDPRAIVREVTVAVEADRASTVRSQWTALEARDSANPTARLALATLARLTYEYPSADSLYRSLFAVTPTDDRHVSAYAHLGLAEGLYEQGRLGEIDQLLVKARADARATGDRGAEGQAILWLGRIRSLSQGAEVGIALVDTALRITPRDVSLVQAASRCLRAQFRLVLGDPSASQELASALDFSRRVSEPRAEAMCLRVRALEHRFAGHYDSTLADLRMMEEIRRRTRDRSRRAEALFLEGEALLDLAAFGEALNAWHLALAEAGASHNLYVLASTKLALAALYFRLNDNATAAGYVKQAIREYTAQADTGGLMMARSWSMQVKEATGDFGGARQETLDAIGFFRRQGDISHEADLYQTLADIAMREGDWGAAAQALDSAAGLLKVRGTAAADPDMPSYRGRLALLQGDLGTAERNFKRYLASLGSREGLWQYETRAYLAEIYARRNQLDQAERELTLATSQLDAWRATLEDRELRTLAFQASTSEANDRNNSIAWVLAMLAKGGRAAAAFALAEHRRARELADRMGRAQALVSSRPDSQTNRSAPASEKNLDAPTLAALIPDDSTAILEYATGAYGAPTTVFLVGRPGRVREIIRAAVLPPADSLAGEIGRLIAFLESGDQAPAIARALGAALFDPILPDLDSSINRLIIIPDGPLHRLPFDVLLLPDGRSLVERFAISTVPSARILVDLWQRPRDLAPQTTRLLALGDPSFPTGQPGSDVGQAARAAAATYQEAFASAGGLPRLEGSAREVERAARYAASADVRLRESASAAFLKRADLTGYQIVHLATHALVDEHAAGRTALVLAPGEGETGYLGPGELAGLHLAADLVVVSACQSAGGVVVDGEGVQGLSAPLLQAGARSILATGWRINDRGTNRLIDAFYQELSRGQPEAQALRNAKLRMIQQKRPPGEWAAFTLMGDPTIRVRLRTSHEAMPYWISAAVFGCVALGYGLWKRSARVR